MARADRKLLNAGGEDAKDEIADDDSDAGGNGSASGEDDAADDDDDLTVRMLDLALLCASLPLGTTYADSTVQQESGTSVSSQSDED